MALVYKKSQKDKPPRILVSGGPGVGKTTFASKFEAPIFISQEGGADQLEVNEVQGISSWDYLKKSLTDMLNEKHDFKTLVVDSIDWLEKLAHQQIIGSSGKSIITANGGYGAGFRESEKMHREVIEQLEQLRKHKNMAIVLIAHTHVKGVKDPSLALDYDSHEIKCHDMVSSLWREWVDALFFVRFKTFVKDNGRAVTDGTRVLHTTNNPSFQAKNRYNMPSEIVFSLDAYDEVMKYIKGEQDPMAEINEMILKISDQALVAKIKSSISAGGDLAKIKQKLKELTNGNV